MRPRSPPSSASATRHHVVESHELEVPGLRRQPDAPLRAVQDRADGRRRPIAGALGDAPVALGTNLDDLGDVRPGIAAAREPRRADAARRRRPHEGRGARRCRASSACARGTSRSSRACRRGSRTARRSRPTGCAASTRSRTACARSASASSACASTTRSRASSSTAPSSPGSSSVRERVVALGKQLGFTYVALDLAGFRSGSLNEVLPAETLVQLRSRPGVVSRGRRRSSPPSPLALAAAARSPARAEVAMPKKDRERAAKAAARTGLAAAPGTKPAKLVNLYNAWTHEWLAVDPGEPPPRGDARSLPARSLHEQAAGRWSRSCSRSWSRAAAALPAATVVDRRLRVPPPEVQPDPAQEGPPGRARQPAHARQRGRLLHPDDRARCSSTRGRRRSSSAASGSTSTSGFVHMDTGPIRFWSGE